MSALDLDGLRACPNPWCTSSTTPLPARFRHDGWVVMCACGVRTFGYKTDDEAIAAWNRRAPDARISTLEREVQQAREALENAQRDLGHVALLCDKRLTRDTKRLAEEARDRVRNALGGR